MFVVDGERGVEKRERLSRGVGVGVGMESGGDEVERAGADDAAAAGYAFVVDAGEGGETAEGGGEEVGSGGDDGEEGDARRKRVEGVVADAHRAPRRRAGLGADRRKDTLGARLAKGLAGRLGQPVRLRTAAIVGSESSALAEQIDGLPERYVADVAVIVVGGNDVTHRIPVSVSAGHLRTAIMRLRARGIPVVVGTCPDLGALRPVPQPLRILGSQMSRQLAAAQAAIAEKSGATAVSLRSAVGRVFFEQPDEMFGVDRFHPSALGYRRTAEALLPVVVAAVESRSAVPARV